MRELLRRCAGLSLAIGLAACFESTEPLIRASEADYPFDRLVRYTLYDWDEPTRNWQPSETGQVTREGDRYFQLDDGSPETNAKPFLLKAIGGGLYIAQQPDASGYIYDLLRIQDQIVYEYGFACIEADRKYLDQGLLDTFVPDTPAGNTCTVSSFDKLRQIFVAAARERPQPKGMYAIQR